MHCFLNTIWLYIYPIPFIISREQPVRYTDTFFPKRKCIFIAFTSGHQRAVTSEYGKDTVNCRLTHWGTGLCWSSLRLIILLKGTKDALVGQCVMFTGFLPEFEPHLKKLTDVHNRWLAIELCLHQNNATKFLQSRGRAWNMNVKPDRHCQGEIEWYFWKNSLNCQREKNSFNVKVFVALNIILCSYKNAKNCEAGWRILDKYVWSFYTLEL